MNATEQDEHLSNWKPVREWVKNCGGRAFSTFAATEWFIRRHRARLVESGQFIIRKGSAGSLVGPGFDRVVLDILREESQRALSEPEAA